MRALHLLSLILFFMFLFVQSGCGTANTPEPIPTDANSSDLAVYARFAPAKVDILPLTDFVDPGDELKPSTINVFVSLLDFFGSAKKSPGVFRFELYEYVPRSSGHMGGRIILWPDYDLTDPTVNNSRWRDFLRAYEFDLDFEPTAAQSYVLQVTCMSPHGRRLSTEVILQYTK